MLLSCPSCEAQFRIAPEKLGVSGRRVRCSKCRHEWHATADDGRPETPEEAPAPRQPEPAPGPDPDPGPPSGGETNALDEELTEFRAAHRRAMRSANPEPAAKRRSPVGWTVFFLVVAGLAAAGWFGRERIVERFPRAAAVYELASVPVNTVAPGLELRDVSRSRQLTNGASELVIQGRIVNTAGSTRKLPPMRAVLMNEQGQPVGAWRFTARADRIAAGEATTFATTKDDPPKTARNLRIEFLGGS